MATPVESKQSKQGWASLEAAADRLAERAGAAVEPDAFYAEAGELLAEALAAEGVGVWLCDSGRINSIHTAGQLSPEAAESAARCAETRAAIDVEFDGGAFLAVSVADLIAQEKTHAVIGVLLPVGASEATHAAAAELLETVAQRATDYHAGRELRSLRKQGEGVGNAAVLARLQSSRGLQAVATEAVNEARRLLGLDRVSLYVERKGRRPVLAVSGVERVEPRGEAARGLTDVAKRVAAWGERVEHRDDSDTEDLPPEVAGAIATHADASHARWLAAEPVKLKLAGEEAQPMGTAVLIGERFTPEWDRGDSGRLGEFAALCAPALAGATRLDSTLVRGAMAVQGAWSGVLDRLGLGRTGITAAAAAVCVAALVFVPVDFEVEASATLQPATQRHVFAGEDGIVAEVLVHHGGAVAAGQVLARLRDPELAVQLAAVAGEAETVRRRLEAIAVARTDRRVREKPDSEGMPLGAEALQLIERLASLERQEQILVGRREALEAASPIAGRVLDLDVEQRLRDRPVARGEVLMTVADPEGGWRLEVDLPQDRAGYVAAAMEESDQPLPVRYRLAGDARTTHAGVLEEISESVPLEAAGADEPSPPLRAVVRAEGALPGAARAGMDATVRIDCGRRSVGFVWLHEAWQTVYRWVTF